MTFNPVYEPREDSYLLQEEVRKRAFGTVLDTGTGTGIQALTAAQLPSVSSVVAVDINPLAVEYAEKRSSHPKIKYIVSDLFSFMSLPEFSGVKFDFMIFNPPYLPSDDEIARYAADIAVDGGPSGLDVITRFIADAKDFLARNGKILIVASNHTDLAFLEKFAIENGYSIRSVRHLKLDFETLYVFELARRNDG